MNLDKIFGSKTKVDVIKYLLFRRQGVSMRALENELTWTFPAIKKQVDSLNESRAVVIDKDHMKWSIKLEPNFGKYIKEVFIYALLSDLHQLFENASIGVHNYFLGKVFGYEVDMDMIIIYDGADKSQIDGLKEAIGEVFRKFLIESVSITFMSSDEWQKRYRLADRFVLQIMRNAGKPPHLTTQ